MSDTGAFRNDDTKIQGNMHIGDIAPYHDNCLTKAA